MANVKNKVGKDRKFSIMKRMRKKLSFRTCCKKVSSVSPTQSVKSEDELKDEESSRHQDSQRSESISIQQSHDDPVPTIVQNAGVLGATTTSASLLPATVQAIGVPCSMSRNSHKGVTDVKIVVNKGAKDVNVNINSAVSREDLDKRYTDSKPSNLLKKKPPKDVGVDDGMLLNDVSNVALPTDGIVAARAVEAAAVKPCGVHVDRRHRDVSLKNLVEVSPTLEELLEDGWLEKGMSVKYKNASSNMGLAGETAYGGILCFCRNCDGRKVVTPNDFELHAGCSTNRPADYIYLRDETSLQDVIQRCKKSYLIMKDTFRNEINSLTEKKPACLVEGIESKTDADIGRMASHTNPNQGNEVFDRYSLQRLIVYNNHVGYGTIHNAGQNANYDGAQKNGDAWQEVAIEEATNQLHKGTEKEEKKAVHNISMDTSRGKVKFCCCHPPKMAGIRTSRSKEPYYKCRSCGFHTSVKEDDFIKFNEEDDFIKFNEEDDVKQRRGGLKSDVATKKSRMFDKVANYITLAPCFVSVTILIVTSLMTVILYLVLKGKRFF